jgi:hypothetical protein
MGCNCAKKNGAVAQAMGPSVAQLLDPVEWGPILWKYLHCLAEKLGTTNNKIVDTDQANYMSTLITMLPLILPCTECQGHAAAYLAANPLPVLQGLYGTTLQTTVRTWIFLFHQEVRQTKGQPTMINTVEECAALYAGCAVPKCEYTSFVQSIAAAVRQGLVKLADWKKWYSNSERLRILAGL